MIEPTPGNVPDWQLNLQPFGAWKTLQPSHVGPGPSPLLLRCCLLHTSGGCDSRTLGLEEASLEFDQ